MAVAAPVANAQTADQSAVYTVQTGDTLIDLGQKYLIGARAWQEVGRLNRVGNPNQIPVGKRLTIPRRLLRTTPIDLRLQSFSGPVTISNGATRATPQAGLVLVEGTNLETGVNGFLSITGSDGSRFTLPSNSRVRIGKARRYLLGNANDIDVEVQRGRAEVKAAPQRPGSQFKVRTPIAVSAVRGTAYRVGYEEGSQVSFTEVLEGGVSVSTTTANAKVDAGFGAASAPQGGIVTEPLLPAPALLAPTKVQTEVQLGFAANPVPGAKAYRFQLARDAGFLDGLAELTAAEPSASFPGMANGNFFVRTSAVAASGLEGQAETNSFRRQQIGLQADVAEIGIPGGLRFEWRADGEGSALYRFQLFGPDSGDAPVIDRAGLRDQGLTLTGLKPGTYRWRLNVSMATPDGSAAVWSALQTIKINN